MDKDSWTFLVIDFSMRTSRNNPSSYLSECGVKEDAYLTSLSASEFAALGILMMI